MIVRVMGMTRTLRERKIRIRQEIYEMKKTLGHIGVVAVYLLLIWLLNINLKYEKPADYPMGIEYAKAKVISVLEDDMGCDPDYEYIRIGRQKLKMEIVSGNYEGKTVDVINYVSRTIQTEGQIGDTYIIGSYDGFVTTMITNYDRSDVIYILGILFLALVLWFGKRKGVSAISALFITLVNVVFLFMPLLINGVPAILAAILVVLLSTMYTMFVLNGITRKSMIATMCCTLCTAVAGVLAFVVGKVGNISTLNTPEAENLLFITENTTFRIDNLLTAGILIAAMGAVMDTSMSIVSSLYEIKEQNPNISSKQLFESGLNIGRDIMGTMTNTLVLAFVGASINSVLVYYMYSMPYMNLINTDFIVVEMVKGLIGSMAVVFSIPVATVLTVKFMD